MGYLVPNGFGCALGTMQLILYFIYHKNKDEQKKPEAANGSVEMGQEKKALANGSKSEEV
ncbi:hypothetical protein Pint_33512 [Pistacia integerrima]|uniref:Uncharacterized protein n=1 Tax=Pistacia integerrima TaxID=434235 RepID=A0ACC0X5V0_9ROSI|nr:hypothetical protein Pint_33512 [Pistacia integerrima]